MKATKENYLELLNEIADNYNLYGVTSVNQRNGYPSGIITLLEGLESEEQAQEILDKYEGAKLFELQWKEGWDTRYRLNSDVANRAYEADGLWRDDSVSSIWRKGDSVKELEIFYLGEGQEDDAERIIEDFSGIGLELAKPQTPFSECGIDEYEAFIAAAEELLYDSEQTLDEAERKIEKIKDAVKWVKDFRDEFLRLKAGEALIIENNWSYRTIEEKSMYWSDGDVTYRCIAIGFDPFFLPSEEEDDE